MLKSLLIVLFLGLVAGSAFSRNPINKSVGQQSLASSYSNRCVCLHQINKLNVMVQNSGRIGADFYDTWRSGSSFRDCLTNRLMISGCEFPRKSILRYFYYADLMVGGIVWGDTLVSSTTDEEFLPVAGELGQIQYRSTVDTTFGRLEGAVSEQDFVSTFSDTGTQHADYYPYYTKASALNIEVTQTSYGWSFPFAEDFIFVDFSVKNKSNKPIEQMYIGVQVAPYVGLVNGKSGWDLVGFIKAAPSPNGCGFKDTLNLSWMADASGDPYEGEWLDQIKFVGDTAFKSIRDIVGIAFMPDPWIDEKISFNWIDSWINFQPQMKKSYRAFDDYGFWYYNNRDEYHLLSNGEIDYDMLRTYQVTAHDFHWMYPRDRRDAYSVSEGGFPDYIHSIGPWKLLPQTEQKVTLAIVGGEGFHNDIYNAKNNIPLNPDQYYENVDFSDLTLNATWAKKIYDNPGIDTDGDGFRGKFRVCHLDSIFTEVDSQWIVTQADTSFYEGDGIPDKRAIIPPIEPEFWIEPTVSGIHVRFNGARSENYTDPLTEIKDFEGYNIWLGRDDRPSSYSLMASYDLYNFDKYRFDPKSGTFGNFILDDVPSSIEELRCLYGAGSDPCNDSIFDPLDYTRGNAYFHPDFPESTFYFERHHHNSQLYGKGVSKIYPNAQKPPSDLHPDSLGSETYYTKDGYLKYYEYEFTIENLLETVPYYVSVTAFDFGSPKQGINPLETDRADNPLNCYPLTYGEAGTTENLVAYIYPNPYRIDTDYRGYGYEGRALQHLPPDKTRAIHFANLPAQCTISIFTIDGDLVRRLEHDFTETDPNRFHHMWNLINRNRQIVVSGLYYWTVEGRDGKVQMGKLVILM